MQPSHCGTKPENGHVARSAARRGAILFAALDDFSTRGFDATRIDDVAKRAGVGKGTVYLYFKDKERPFQELILTVTPLIGAIDALGAVDMPVNAFAERLTDLFVREVYETRRRDVIRLIISEGRRFPNLAEFYYREVLSRVLKIVRMLMRRALKRGELADDVR